MNNGCDCHHMESWGRVDMLCTARGKHLCNGCNSVQVCATLCNSLQVCATLCNYVQLCATLCKSVQVRATLCNSVQVCATLCKFCFVPPARGYPTPGLTNPFHIPVATMQPSFQKHVFIVFLVATACYVVPFCDPCRRDWPAWLDLTSLPDLAT